MVKVVERATILIVFAWAAESIGASLGVVNSISITFGKNPPEFGLAWLVAVPAVALALFELARIPLVQASASPQRAFYIRGLALTATLCLIGITFENWMFGLERMLDYRLSEVTRTRDGMLGAQTALAEYTEKQLQQQATLKEVIDKERVQVQGLTEKLNQRKAQQTIYQKEVIQNCRFTPAGDGCFKKAMDQEAKETNSLTDSLDSSRLRYEEASKKLSLIQSDTAQLDQLQDRAKTAQREFIRVADDSPVYRVGAYFFGVAPDRVSDAQVGLIRSVFASFGASIISILGTVLAFVYYWPGVDSKRSMSVRAFFTRLRRRMKFLRQKTVVVENRIEVPVEKIVEKTIPLETRYKTIHKQTTRFVPYTGKDDPPADIITVGVSESLEPPAGVIAETKESHHAAH